MGKVKKFLEAGHKVKITIFYRGRELAHKEIGFKLADRVIQDIFGDTIILDQNPQFAGKQLNFVIRHNPKGVAKPAATEESEAAEPKEQLSPIRIVKAKKPVAKEEVKKAEPEEVNPSTDAQGKGEQDAKTEDA
jgi:hypothetical protein